MKRIASKLFSFYFKEELIMSNYMKKPIIIEAFKWTGGEDQTEDPTWIADAIKERKVVFGVDEDKNTTGMYIETLGGVMQANVGDYIIKGITGEIYPCKPEIFEMTHMRIENLTMNFSEALFLIKQGKKVARKGWNNPNIWLELQRPYANSQMTIPYIYMVKYENKFPCDLSCESIMAEDWKVVE